MELSVDLDQLEQAKFYDKMIPWEKRLARELPLIIERFHPGTILDMACSSGRHTFGLEKHGFQSLGIDLSEGMIYLANELKKQNSSNSIFLSLDGADLQLIDKLRELQVDTYYDNALLLGNAVANMGNIDAARRLIANIFLLLRPGGRFITQTVFRPSKPHYLPLRRPEPNNLIQRIMIPVINEEYNVTLHVNRINPETGEYIERVSGNEFYMFTKQEFQALLTKIGFKLLDVYGGFNKEEVLEDDGATLVWVFEKPEIQIYPRGMELFQKYCNFDKEQIIKRTLSIWQDCMKINQYHCLRGYRFLYPRITSHPRYKELLEGISDKWILDLGCNLGTDIRQLIIDGADPGKIVGLDLNESYFSLGKQLFDDTDRIKVSFINGNFIDPSTLDITNHEGKLAEYQGRFSIIHAGSIIHLLDERDVEVMIRKIYYLLEEGGIFFGRTMGKGENEIDTELGLNFMHSPQSLKTLFVESGFGNVTIDIIGEDGPIGERSVGEYLSMMFFVHK